MTHHTPSLFTIATGSVEPIYRQFMDQVRRKVAGGQLLAGDVLPSVRDVAQHLAVNPMTVSKAYNMLETEGLVQRKRGLGMQVVEQAQEQRHVSNRSQLLRPTLERAAQEARQLELDRETALALFDDILRETP